MKLEQNARSRDVLYRNFFLYLLAHKVNELIGRLPLGQFETSYADDDAVNDRNDKNTFQ